MHTATDGNSLNVVLWYCTDMTMVVMLGVVDIITIREKYNIVLRPW